MIKPQNDFNLISISLLATPDELATLNLILHSLNLASDRILALSLLLGII